MNWRPTAPIGWHKMLVWLVAGGNEGFALALWIHKGQYTTQPLITNITVENFENNAGHRTFQKKIGGRALAVSTRFFG